MSEWHDPDRFLAGLDLYRPGKAPRLLFTGGASPFRHGQPPEGQRYLREAQQLGIPAGVMASTPPVVNTAEEAVAIRRLLAASKTSEAFSPRILLVTSAFQLGQVASGVAFSLLSSFEPVAADACRHRLAWLPRR